MYALQYICNYSRKAAITMHNFPRTPRKERGEIYKDNTNATYKTTDAQTKRNCNRRTALELSVGKLCNSLLLCGLFYRGDLLYVLPCVILFLCFSVLLVLRLPRLVERELILVLFVRLFDLYLFGFVGFLFLLMSGKGCGL